MSTDEVRTTHTIILAAPCSQITWGIIRYAAGSGLLCEDDAAGFDGWYTAREDALAIARRWAARFPQWIVALVRSDQIWFGDGDFGTVRDRALTYRENIFKNGRPASAPPTPTSAA
jgi:hypothetical protein